MSTTVFAPTSDDLQQLVTEVWSSHVLTDELVPIPPFTWVAPTGEATVACWSSAVSVTGAWQGMIAVDLSEPSAWALARGMLGMDEDEHLAAIDLSDAVGEFANIVGGNIKSLMPGPSQLSLPLVAHDVIETPSDLHPQLSLDLVWRDAPVRVRVLTLPTTQNHGHSEVTP